MMARNTKSGDGRPISVRLSGEEHKHLRVAAAEEDMSLGALARRILREWLEQRSHSVTAQHSTENASKHWE